MSERLPTEAREAAWAALGAHLLSGVHPEDGDPFRGSVPVVIYEPIAVHDAATLDRLRAAMAAVGGRRLVALGFGGDGEGHLVPNEAFALDVSMDAVSWSDAGFAEGWGVNGMSFVFADETARWALLTVVDVQVVACEAGLLGAFFRSVADARQTIEEFRLAFDVDNIMPAFRAMAGRARLPAT